MKIGPPHNRDILYRGTVRELPLLPLRGAHSCIRGFDGMQVRSATERLLLSHHNTERGAGEEVRLAELVLQVF